MRTASRAIRAGLILIPLYVYQPDRDVWRPPGATVSLTGLQDFKINQDNYVNHLQLSNSSLPLSVVYRAMQHREPYYRDFLGKAMKQWIFGKRVEYGKLRRRVGGGYAGTCLSQLWRAEPGR